MKNEPKGLRERIHDALAEPVEDAEKLLSELTDADSETKLSILISGWGRGFAAALEELAIAVDDLRAHVSQEPERARATPAEERPPPQPKGDEQTEQSERSDTADLGEGRLLDEAKKSREATAELRREAERARREVEQ